MKMSQRSGQGPPGRPGLTPGGWFAIAVGTVVLVWGLSQHERPDGALAAAASPAAQALPGTAPMPAPSTTPAPTPSPTAAAGGAVPGHPPAGLSAAQWQALQAELADHPDRAREIARVAAYLGYRAAVQRFTALREAGSDPAQRLEAARAVDAGLDERLARGELSAPEGLLLKMATAQVLHPDPAVQQETVARWRTHVAARVAPANDPREAAFRQQEAALMAQYRALPAAQRDPARLNEALQALRVRIFDGASTAPQDP